MADICLRSLLGGFLILTLGILYIAFEDSLLEQTATRRDEVKAAAGDRLSRTILGVQVSAMSFDCTVGLC